MWLTCSQFPKSQLSTRFRRPTASLTKASHNHSGTNELGLSFLLSFLRTRQTTIESDRIRQGCAAKYEMTHRILFCSHTMSDHINIFRSAYVIQYYANNVVYKYYSIIYSFVLHQIYL